MVSITGKLRLCMLQTIFSHFQQITQWLPTNIDSASEYMMKAEALIQFMESADCGSWGGRDKHNLHKDVTNYRLYDRFFTLLRKYNDERNITPECGFTPAKMATYFKKVRGLREKCSK